jgi:hypothetical protein
MTPQDVEHIAQARRRIRRQKIEDAFVMVVMAVAAALAALSIVVAIGALVAQK